jgi:uncharacterized protein YcfJ
MEKLTVVIAAILILPLAGCAMTEGEQKGALAGGAIGAATGAIIGHQSGETGEGAVIGGALGALTGTIVGGKMEKERANNPNHLAMSTIVTMSQQGADDQTIINEIKSTSSVYYLNAEAIDYLRNNGVSNAVINYMISTGQG